MLHCFHCSDVFTHVCRPFVIVFISYIQQFSYMAATAIKILYQQVRWLSSQGPQCSEETRNTAYITDVIFILLHQRAARAYFWRFFIVKFAAITNTLLRNLSARIILVQESTFVPNMTVLGLLCPEWDTVGEKRSLSYPLGLFRHLWTSVLRTHRATHRVAHWVRLHSLLVELNN